MTTASTKFRLAAAAFAVGAATLTPAVANATPAVPLPQASVFDFLGGDSVAPCDPEEAVCALAAADSPLQNSAFWFGPPNPAYQPLIGIVFPNIFGINFEGCILGGGGHFSSYTGQAFIGLSLGC